MNRRLDQSRNALTHSGPGYETGADPAQLQQQVAFRIRAELVCCDIYERVQQDARRIDRAREQVDPDEAATDDPTDFGVQGAIGNAIVRKDWHDLCYWAEAAARIAEGRCPGYETEPNICRCPCEGCKRNCAAHTGE